MISPTCRLALLCALAAQLLLAVLAPAFVVCVESDGQSAVEWRGDSDCCSGDVEDDFGRPQQTPQIRSLDDCAGCDDGVFSVTLRRDEGLSFVMTAPAFYATTPMLGWGTESRDSFSRRAPRDTDTDGALLALRTVNLRC